MNKTFLVSFIAILAIIVTLTSVSANGSVDPFVKIDLVKINGVVVEEGGLAFAGSVSEVIPVEVQFTALATVSDARVEVEIKGYRDEISESSSRFHVVNGSQYVKRFSIRLPSSTEIDERDIDQLTRDLTEKLILKVEITGKNDAFGEPIGEVKGLYSVRLHKDLYSLNILSVETAPQVLAGSSTAVDIVLENNGNSRLDNVYVKVSVPELGVEREVYFGDISPNYERSNLDISDTKGRRIYLIIPRDAPQGIYDMEIEAFNFDTSTTTAKRIAVGTVETGVIPVVTAKAVAIGQDTTFDVFLVNPGDRMVVYSITPEEAKGLIVEPLEPLVSVSADSSKTVQVRVRATESAEEGTHVVTVNVVNLETEQLVKQVTFSVNVEKGTAQRAVQTTNAVVVLTVILVIVFVVLLIILIVLLTKRPEEEPEEFGETSYY